MKILDDLGFIDEGDMQDPYIYQAVREVYSTYGDKVSVTQKKKSLIKFGRNPSVGTSAATIQEFLGSEVHETYVSSNLITNVVTDDADFTGTVTIEGHTISGSDLTFSSQTKVLTGQTSVTLDTPLARVTRCFISTTDTLASGKKIYVHESDTVTSGVPQTASKTHIIVTEGYNQSQKCSTSLSSSDYWLITKVYGGMLKKTGAVDVNIQMQVRTVGFPFKTLFEIPVNNQGAPWFNIDAPPIFIVPKNSDIRIVGTASTTGVEVIAGIAGYLASVIE